MVAAWPDRLGRSLIHLLDFLRELHAKGDSTCSCINRARHVDAVGQGDVSDARGSLPNSSDR